MDNNERRFELSRSVEIILFEDKSAMIKLIGTTHNQVPLSSDALDRLEKVLKWR